MSTVHNRYHYGLTYDTGTDDMLEAAPSWAAAKKNVIARARRNAELGGGDTGAWIFDSMAHRGRPQLYRMSHDGKWSVTEKRPQEGK
jgi:hypothetical protein